MNHFFCTFFYSRQCFFLISEVKGVTVFWRIPEQYSFTKNFLSQHPNETAQAIAQAREINKAHTTFIDSILRYQHKGRIHAEINQLRNAGGGTVTGRFSYSNPNLQQLPSRNKEIKKQITKDSKQIIKQQKKDEKQKCITCNLICL